MSCLLCFSKESLSRDELKGKYGVAYEPFINNENLFQVTLCNAPSAEPCCWLSSMICLCPAQILMRHRVLNHVEPGSGWKNYICCQGYYGGCCCLQPGNLCEQQCPLPCMCLEACCCPGAAVSANSMVIREQYALGLDEDDVRLIRFNNCLFCCAICLSCISQMTDCEADDTLAAVVNMIADIVFCCTSGCMTAQMHHEMKVRDQNSSPTRETMVR
mmetsp:Transcript_5650/g.8203  ORF Transcript_5650/g.8203 Transcript_5650/m.8203 type:complete len:216 (+) Transcript_5650:86-733(+)